MQFSFGYHNVLNSSKSIIESLQVKCNHRLKDMASLVVIHVVWVIRDMRDNSVLKIWIFHFSKSLSPLLLQFLLWVTCNKDMHLIL